MFDSYLLYVLCLCFVSAYLVLSIPSTSSQNDFEFFPTNSLSLLIFAFNDFECEQKLSILISPFLKFDCCGKHFMQ